MQPEQPQPNLLEKLNRCLERFIGVHINNIDEHYTHYPNFEHSLLGKGSQGSVYRMKSVKNPNEALRAVKVIKKSSVTEKESQLRYVASELAVLFCLRRHPNINHRVSLYHTDDNIYIPMELVEGKEPDLATRLYCIFAKHGAKARIADVPRLVAECPPGKEEQLVKDELRHVGETKEDPLSGDVCTHIMHHGQFPVTKALIIAKQALQGLKYLHENSIVHRDVKTKNLVLCVERKAVPIFGNNEGGDKAIVGVRIEETLDVRLIDFGLIKCLVLGNTFPQSPAPFNFGALVSPFVGEVKDPFKNAAPMVPNLTAAPTRARFDDFVLSSGNDYRAGAFSAPEAIAFVADRGYIWVSTAENIHKLDVYGVGAVLYRMCNSTQPFGRLRLKFTEGPREEQAREWERLIKGGLKFPADFPEALQPLTSKLMSIDVNKRPNSIEALQDPLFKGLTNKYVYEVMVDGTVFEVNDAGDRTLCTAAKADVTREARDTQESMYDRALMRIMRKREGSGDRADDEEDDNIVFTPDDTSEMDSASQGV